MFSLVYARLRDHFYIYVVFHKRARVRFLGFKRFWDLYFSHVDNFVQIGRSIFAKGISVSSLLAAKSRAALMIFAEMNSSAADADE